MSQAQSLDAKLVPTDLAASDRCGSAVAVKGSVIVIGAPFADAVVTDAGAAYVYQNVAGAWTQVAKLVPPDPIANGRFGSAVDVTPTRIVVGAPGAMNPAAVRCGAMYVYEPVGTVWTLASKVVPSDGQADDRFGAAVSADQDRIAVGAPSGDGVPFVTDPGAVYVYDKSGSSWSEIAKILEMADGQDFDGFGSAVALTGNRVLASAPLAYDGGNLRGRAQICEQYNAWDPVQKLTPTPQSGDGWFYGTAVAIDGDRAIVTSPYGGPLGGYYVPGIADVWEKSGSSWMRVERIGPGAVDIDDLENGIGFGVSVDLDGDTFVVGSRDANQNGDGRGAAWIYRRTSGGFAEVGKLVPNDSAPFDAFARAVGISGATVVCGAPADDDHGNDSGGAWVGSAPTGLGNDFVGVPSYLNPCGAPCSFPPAQTMFLDAGPAHAGDKYLVLGSVTGTSPGIPLGIYHLPLDFDFYTQFTAQGTPGLLTVPIGTLDASGRATLQFVLPPNLPGFGLDGVRVYHAAVLMNPLNNHVRGVTSATQFTFSS